jgi:hypothetical protein
MSRSPYGRNDVCDALNGCVCKSGQDVGEVIADRDLEPSTTFHNREDGGYARPSLFAADMDPVGAANCDPKEFGSRRARKDAFLENVWHQKRIPLVGSNEEAKAAHRGLGAD